MTVKAGKKTIIVKNLILPAVEDMTRYGLGKSVEITNKMQPCNRIYYSKVH